jgi:hypothetical protein
MAGRPGRAPGITPTAFARKIGVSPSTISRAISEGRIRKAVVKYGPRWRVVDEELAIAEYRENTRELAGKLGPPQRIDATPRPSTRGKGPERAPGPTSKYQRERAEKLAAERKLAELKLKEKTGELVRVDVAGKLYADTFADLRTNLLAIPDRLAVDLAGLDDASTARTILRDALVETLRDAADKLSKGSTEIST